MHGDGHHMMDWMSGGALNWLYILAGWIIFLLLVVILLYVLNRGSHNYSNNNDLRNQSSQNLSFATKIDKRLQDRSFFCPNCGEKLDGETSNYCPKCGSEI